MIIEANIMIITLKCNQCGTVFHDRRYLSLSEFEQESVRLHFCDKCRKERK